jgi:hypothetical protein
MIVYIIVNKRGDNYDSLYQKYGRDNCKFIFEEHIPSVPADLNKYEEIVKTRLEGMTEIDLLLPNGPGWAIMLVAKKWYEEFPEGNNLLCYQGKTKNYGVLND